MKDEVFLSSVNGQDTFQALHDAETKKIVIFCHGFRGTSIGPSRSFVTIARRLSECGISSLRFDQHGSGNSEGDFVDSSFYDWVETTKQLAKKYIDAGFQVALFGQSMGGATVIDVASQIQEVTGCVAWVPDPNVDEGDRPHDEVSEEGGQLIRARYWLEARDSKIADKLRAVKCPVYIVQCSDDEYVSDANHSALVSNAQSNHHLEMLDGYSHSAWTNEQFENIIAKSVDFLIQIFES